MDKTTARIVKTLQEKRMDFCQLREVGFKLQEINAAYASGHVSCNIFGVYSAA